jgi:hypothetical protein
MTWTQPVCENRFQMLYPGRVPVRLKIPMDDWDPCCYCKRLTNIYVRLDPKTVPYPMEK